MGVTHLQLPHKGKTTKFRDNTSDPTDPTPETGDVYINTVDGREALGFYCVNRWLYVPLVYTT